jgi:hypothetical protein
VEGKRKVIEYRNGPRAIAVKTADPKVNIDTGNYFERKGIVF